MKAIKKLEHLMPFSVKRKILSRVKKLIQVLNSLRPKLALKFEEMKQ